MQIQKLIKAIEQRIKQLDSKSEILPMLMKLLLQLKSRSR
jgi:hypothetical protein